MDEKKNWTYCVVGNIKKNHFDEEGVLRYGTAAFTGGTKVYLHGRIWDRSRSHIDALGLNRRNELQVVWTDIAQIENALKVDYLSAFFLLLFCFLAHFKETVLTTPTLAAVTNVEKKHIILVTDGMPGDPDPAAYLEQARLNKEAGITMSIVGIDCDFATNGKSVSFFKKNAVL